MCIYIYITLSSNFIYGARPYRFQNGNDTAPEGIVYKERPFLEVRHIRETVKFTEVHRTRCLRVNKERQAGIFFIPFPQTGTDLSNTIVWIFVLKLIINHLFFFEICNTIRKFFFSQKHKNKICKNIHRDDSCFTQDHNMILRIVILRRIIFLAGRWVFREKIRSCVNRQR